MSLMLFEKHEILAIQDGCVATHRAVYSVLPSKYTFVLVLWLFFNVIVVPENSNSLKDSKKLWPAYFPFIN